MCLIACVAVNGFHGSCSYEWKRSEMIVGDTPLYYTSMPGLYTCNVSCPGHNVSSRFKVIGEYSSNIMITMIILNIYFVTVTSAAISVVKVEGTFVAL